MKKIIVTIITIAAFLSATLPSLAQETVATTTKHPVQIAQFVDSGTPLTTNEMAEYEQKDKVQQKDIDHEGAGSDVSPGVIILACIGALVVVGAVIYAAHKNNSSN